MAGSPLAGIRVIELCGWHTGPMATCMLADQGADVIKVEPPGGDTYRQSGTSRGGHAAMFMAANRNKRSVELDLKRPEHKEALLALVAKADVFVQNMKAGAMGRLGLGPEELRAINPRLIYCSVSGYGQTGPNASEGAYDTMMQALGGLAVVQADKGDRPRLVRTLVADKITSPMVAQAITAALLQRERTGQGCTVDCPMLDLMVWWMWPDAMMNHTFLGDGVRRGIDVADVDLICRTDDGYLVATPHLEANWQSFVDLIGRPDLRDDPRLATARDRMRNLDAYTGAVRDSFAGKTTEEWCRLLRGRGIPCAPVLAPDQIRDYPQVVWNELIEEVEHPEAGRHLAVRAPVRFDGEANCVIRPCPSPGADTTEILREFGIILPSD